MSRRLLILQEIPSTTHTHSTPTANPLTPSPININNNDTNTFGGAGGHNTIQYTYQPINKLGLPISSPAPFLENDLPSLLDLPLRVLNAFTEIFNAPRYKGWVIVAAGPYKDPTVRGVFYAVVLQREGEKEREEEKMCPG